ncbi:transferase [Synergistales bacterium]|nr:transferase [Synergistales bacterium]
MARYIIGAHSGHDASACLFKDNTLVCAIAKERLTRKKHDSGEPVECIEYLLDACKLCKSEIDMVVRCNWYDSRELDDAYYNGFKNVKINKNHHLFHAYALSLANNGGCDMLALILDGRGCRLEDAGELNIAGANLFESESVYKITGNRIIPMEKMYAEHFPNEYKWGSHLNSVGYAYATVSKAVFQSAHAAGKIMALAAFGKENANIPQVFCDNIRFEVNREWLSYIENLVLPINFADDMAKDLSYSVQSALERYIELRVKSLVDSYLINTIGISGGVALNCKNNRIIANKPYISKLLVFPASGDDGLSIGAALWAIREIFNDWREVVWDIRLGKIYRQTVFDESAINRVVKLLLNGECIGLFENGSEYGPRALCNRSLIADAMDVKMKDYMNIKVKEREQFRPFGGVVLARNLKMITSDKLANPYMLSAAIIKPEYQNRIPALVHADGTVRLQVVSDKNTSIYKILEEYERETGGMVLINTSFNSKDEPIVETENEAFASAKKMGIHYMLSSGTLKEILSRGI